MKNTNIITLLFFLLCLTCSAQTPSGSSVNFDLTTFYGLAGAANRQFLVAPIGAPQAYQAPIIIPDVLATNTDNTGQCVVSNMAYPLIYKVTVLPPPQQGTFFIFVNTNNLGVVLASSIMSAYPNTTFPQGSVAWSALGSDERYYPLYANPSNYASGGASGFMTVTNATTNLFQGSNSFTGNTYFKGTNFIIYGAIGQTVLVGQVPSAVAVTDANTNLTTSTAPTFNGINVAHVQTNNVDGLDAILATIGSGGIAPTNVFATNVALPSIAANILFVPTNYVTPGGTNTLTGASNTATGPFYANGGLVGAATSATNAGNASNLTAVVGTIGGTNVTTAITNDANLRGVQLAQLSVIGGGNELTDMFTSTNAFDGQLGNAESGGASGGALWQSRGGPGTGTNVWGFPIDILGGIDYIGNPFWYDIPKSANMTPLQITWGGGPTASRLTSAYNGGNTNGSTIQPELYLVDYNPFNGAGGIFTRGSFTNSALGILAGTNADGTKIYTDQYGVGLVELGDAYNPLRSAPNNVGAESQQSASYQLLMNNAALPLYATFNSARTGDGGGGLPATGQVPLMVLDARGAPTTFLARFPKQIANVWAVTNASWQDSLWVNESTGQMTNSGGLILGYNNNTGGILLVGPAFSGGGDVSAGMNVNTNTIFNATTAMFTSGSPTAGTALVSWDGAGNERNGVILQNGQYPSMAHGLGTPYNISQVAGNSNIRLGVNSAAATLELQIGADSSVNVEAGNLVVTNGHNTILTGTLQFPSGQYNAAGGSNALTATDATNIVNALTTTGDPNQFTSAAGQFHISTGATHTNIVIGNSNGVAVAVTGYISESGPTTNQPLALVALAAGNVITNGATGGSDGQFLMHSNAIAGGMAWATVTGGGGGSTGWATNGNSGFTGTGNTNFFVGTTDASVFNGKAKGKLAFQLDGTPSASGVDVILGSLQTYSVTAGGGSTVGGISDILDSDNANQLISDSSHIYASSSDSGIFAGNANVLSNNSTRCIIIGGEGNAMEILGGQTDSSIIGGKNNVIQSGYSVAMGTKAMVSSGNDGSFVWADSTTATPFASQNANTFLIRSTGGVGINTNNPGKAMLAIASTSSNAPGLNIYGAFQENVAGQSNAIGIYNTNGGLAVATFGFDGSETLGSGNFTVAASGAINIGGGNATINQFGSGNFGGNSSIINSAGIQTYNGGVVAWSSTSGASGSADTGFSRLSSGSIGVGNGTAADVSGNLQLNQITHYDGISTAGQGVAWIAGITNLINATASATTGGLFTTPAQTNLCEFSGAVTDTASVAGTLTVTLGWTDDTGTAKTANVLSASALVAGTPVSVGPYVFITSPSSVVTVATTRAGTSATYTLRCAVKVIE